MRDDYSYLFAVAFFKNYGQTKKNIDELISELDNVYSIIRDNKKIYDFLNHPAIKLKDKINIVKSLSDNKKIIDFLMILIKVKRIKELKNIIKHLESLKNFSGEKINIELSSVFDINEKELLNIQNALEKYTGRKISINCISDSSLIGGIKVKIGDLIIDYSIKKELELLKERLICR